MDFTQLALLLAVAAVFGIIAQKMHQPVITGYLLAGIFLSSVHLISNPSQLETLSEIGVTLLLFLLGIEMKLGDLLDFGKTSIIAGLGQISLTFLAGFGLSLLFGFNLITAVYIGISLTFASTIVIVKLLSEKKDLSSLYGKISIGILLIQDFVVIAILMFLSGIKRGGLGYGDYLLIFVKVALLFCLVWVLSKKVLPRIFEKLITNSVELIFIVGIAWALGVSVLVAGPLGFSLEIGGFLAGIALSNLPEHTQIISRTKPLRDFFLVIFFLFLGTKLVVGRELLSILPIALVFSLFVVLVKPLIVMFLVGVMGYKKRTLFMTSLNMSQISEFSLILIATGAALGHVNQNIVSLFVMIGVFTMLFSTYLILDANKVYKKFGKFVKIFERRGNMEKQYEEETDLKDHVILVGCDRTGSTLKSFLLRKNIPFVIIDFNPKVNSRLVAEKIHTVFGDVSDPEILNAANIEHAKMVISTISNLADNLTLLENIKKLGSEPVVIMTTSTKEDAVKLYEKGANYLTVPEIIAGEHIKHVLTSYGLNANRYAKIGKSHFNRIISS